MTSFVIPVFNCLAHTQECLRTLSATLPAGLEHEIIFVDDGSTDGTRSWLESLSARRPARELGGSSSSIRILLNERNLGFAASCNRAAATARGGTLYFLNNDLVLLPRWFEPMQDLVRHRAEAGLVGNVQRSVATGAIDHAGVTFNHKAKPEHDRRMPWFAYVRGFRDVPAVTGACFAIRTAVWKQLGGFDEEYRNGGEDVDLCLRARAAGARNFVAVRSVVLHHVSQSAGRKLRDEQNSRRLALRWRTEIALLSARAWSAHHLESAWHGARNPADFAAAIYLFFFSRGLLRRPSLAAVCGADRAIESELQRWNEIIDGARPPTPDTSVRTAEI